VSIHPPIHQSIRYTAVLLLVVVLLAPLLFQGSAPNRLLARQHCEVDTGNIVHLCRVDPAICMFIVN
jgi:hypothetical protein